MEAFSNADCVFFTGKEFGPGIVDLIANTPVHDIIFDRLKKIVVLLARKQSVIQAT